MKSKSSKKKGNSSSSKKQQHGKPALTAKGPPESARAVEDKKE